ncbi:MAG: YfhO family protein [Thermodesulfobacteriota bacterium]|nr:YfhO family protein [Thermodesulfobacteriota bacterium]
MCVRKILIVLGLLGISTAYFYDLLKGDYLFTERDLSVFFIPSRIFWVEAVKNFSLPLWNPYLLSSQPLIATLQPAVFYPLHVIYFLLPFDKAFNYIIVFHYFLAGIFTYILMKKLKASDTAGIIAAVTFMLSGYLLSVHNLLSTLLSVAWVPLLLLLYFAVFLTRDIKYSIFAAVAAGMMFFAGGAIVVYVTFLIILLLTSFPGLFFQKEQRPPIKLRFFYLVVFMVLFLCISAIQLLPFLELVNLSGRADGFSYTDATIWSLHPKDIIQFFIPDFFGYQLRPNEYWNNQSWLKSLYLGSIPFLLSTFFFIKRGGRQIFFAMLMIIPLILAMGKHTPFYALFFHYVPFMDKIRYPVRFLFLSVFVISISSGLGYDYLKEGIKKRDNAVKNLIYVILALGVAGVLLLSLLVFFDGQTAHLLKIKGFGPPHYNDIGINLHNIKRLLIISILLGLVLWVSVRVKMSNRLLSSGIIGLLIFDLFFGNLGFYDRIPAGDYHKNSSVMDFVLSDRTLFRIFVTPLTMRARSIPVKSGSGHIERVVLDKEKIVPGYGLERGIFDASGLGVLVERRFSNISTLIASAPKADSTNLLDMMNVKYVISVPEIKSPRFNLEWEVSPFSTEEIKDTNSRTTIKIYRNLDCQPRAFLVDGYRILSKEDEFKDVLSSREFKPKETVLLEEEAEDINKLRDDFNCKDIGEEVKILEYRNNSILLRVSLPEAKFLFLSELYYPGWKAYVDGKEKKIYRANYAFRAVFLNPGIHQIEFIYRPWTFRLGMTTSAASIIGLIGLGCMMKIQKYRNKMPGLRIEKKYKE